MEVNTFRIIVDVILAGIGLFALIAGITKKGTMFHNPQVDDEKRSEYNKKLQLFMIVSGLGLIAISALDFINLTDGMRLAFYCLMLVWFGYFGVTTRKYLKK